MQERTWDAALAFCLSDLDDRLRKCCWMELYDPRLDTANAKTPTSQCMLTGLDRKGPRQNQGFTAHVISLGTADALSDAEHLRRRCDF